MHGFRETPLCELSYFAGDFRRIFQVCSHTVTRYLLPNTAILQACEDVTRAYLPLYVRAHVAMSWKRHCRKIEAFLKHRGPSLVDSL